MRKKTIALTLSLVGMTLLPFSLEAGNLVKKYVNVSKEGLTAQASDIPTGYGNLESVMKNVIYDFSGNTGTNGTPYNTPKTVPGPKNFGKALDFNGSNQYIQFNNMNIDTNPTARHTVEMWVNWDGSDYGMLWSWMNHQDIALFPDVSGKPAISVNSGCGDYLIVEMEKGKWTHVAVTFAPNNQTISQSNVDIYINGEKKPWIADWPTHCYRGGVTTGGRVGVYTSGDNYHIKAQIDEVRVWNHARTPQQIKDNMNKHLDYKNSNGLIGYWRFD